MRSKPAPRKERERIIAIMSLGRGKKMLQDVSGGGKIFVSVEEEKANRA